MELYHSSIDESYDSFFDSLIDDGNDNLFYSPINIGDNGHFGSPINDGDGVHHEGIISDTKDLPYFLNNHEHMMKVFLGDKYDFIVVKSTTTHFKARCALKSCRLHI